MPEIVVAAELRTETGKNANRRLRAQKQIPGIVYGGKSKVVAIAVAPTEILRVLHSDAGENTLFDLDLGGKRRKVILKDYQIQPVSGALLHADFFEVALDRVIDVRVHVQLEGIPLGVKNEGGSVDFITRELELVCLAKDIPDKISHDITSLALGMHLRVSDLVLPDTVTCKTAMDVVVAHVVPPRTVQEETETVEEGAVAEVATGETPAADAEKKDS